MAFITIGLVGIINLYEIFNRLASYVRSRMNVRILGLVGTTMVILGACQTAPQPSEPVTPSELAAMLRQQLDPCWQGPMNTPAFTGLEAALEIKMTPDGAIEDITPIEPDLVANNLTLRTFANAAMRAVLQCSPLDMAAVPYDDWHDVVLIFRGRKPDADPGP